MPCGDLRGQMVPRESLFGLCNRALPISELLGVDNSLYADYSQYAQCLDISRVVAA